MLTEIIFLWRSASCSRLEKIEIMSLDNKLILKKSVLDYIRYKQLNWYGHMQKKMNEESYPEKLEWCPPGKKEKGRTRNS